MLIDFEPGDYVRNPANNEWGVGQVQSIIGIKSQWILKIGKRVINVKNEIGKIENDWSRA